MSVHGTANACSPGMQPVDFASLQAVPEIRDLRRADLSGHPLLDSTQPLVLRGLVRDWPAVSLDDEALLALLTDLASGQALTFYAAAPEADGRFFYDEDLRGFNFQRRSATLGDCCAWLAANAGRADAGALYVGSTAVDHWVPGFADTHDFELGKTDTLCSLWLGNETRIAAHFDFPQNIACVVAGRRRFTLFPPQATADLYVGPLEVTPSGQPISLVDFHAVDETRFPRFARALEQAVVAELDPGDALIIPSMWWHHVESLAPVNLLINYWWRESPLHLGSPLNALLHAALAIGQLAPEERATWETLFDRWVFRHESGSVDHLPEHARGVLGNLDRKQAMALRKFLAKQL